MILDITSNINAVVEALKEMPGVAERVLRRAIKRSLVAGRSVAIASIFRRYNLRERTIREAVGDVKVQGLSGDVDFEGSRVKWMEYLSGRQIRPYGVAVQILRDSAPSNLMNAFTIHGNNPKLGVYQRMPGVGKYPIRPTVGPAIPQMLMQGNQTPEDTSKVAGNVMSKMKESLEKNIAHEMGRWLNGTVTQRELDSLPES
jgi:hypothetical protein